MNSQPNEGGYGYRQSDDERVNVVWWAVVEWGDYTYTEAANEFWGLAFGVLADGSPSATLTGPSSRPRDLTMVPDERHWGVEFAPARVLAQD